MNTIRNSFITAMILVIFHGITIAQDVNFFEQQGYTSLFNGKDLTGWIIPEGDNGHWSVLEGVIDYDARSEASGDKNLWTEKEYEDFQLHVEWRFTGYGPRLFAVPTILPSGDLLRDSDGNVVYKMRPNADSGLLLKGVGQANMWSWPVGSGELWSIRNNQNLSPEVRAGAVPTEHADKPLGQWNSFDITVKGDRITVINNGIVVINNAEYPGLDIKGRLGLQHHGGVSSEDGKILRAPSLVQFRNIWIKEL